jgi:hypothetical protein
MGRPPKYGPQAQNDVERRRRSRKRRVRFTWADQINEVVARLSREAADRFLESGILPHYFLAELDEQLKLYHDVWQGISGEPEIIAAWQWRAVQACLADADRAFRRPHRPGREVEKRPDWFYGGWIEDEEGGGHIISPPSKLRDQFQAEFEFDGVRDYHDQVGALWRLRKDLGRFGPTRMLRLREGGEKQFVIAWAAGPQRTIAVIEPLRRLYRGALVWEELRWRWRLPEDFDEKKFSEVIFPAFSKRLRVRAKLPIPGVVNDLFEFAHVRWWPRHYRSECRLLNLPYRAPISFLLDPERGDWGHRPDPENSGVARRTRGPRLFSWDRAGFDTPEHHTSKISEEPEDDEDDIGARPERGAFLYALSIEERGFSGYWQRSPGWAAKHEPAQSYEPLNYDLQRRLDLLDRAVKVIGKHLPILVHRKAKKRYWRRADTKPVVIPGQCPSGYALRHVETPANALSAERKRVRNLGGRLLWRYKPDDPRNERLPDDDDLDRLATSAAIEAA